MFENNKLNDDAGDSRWSLVAFVLILAMDIVVLSAVAFPPVQFKLLVLAFSLLAVLVAWQMHVDRQRYQQLKMILKNMPIPFALAMEPRCFVEYVKITDSLSEIVKHKDGLFRELAMSRLGATPTRLRHWHGDNSSFSGTESWRTAYQRILETLHVKIYYSVAWVRTNDYWNDAPGKQSMRLNYDMVERGFRIERCHILPDELWPFDEKLPQNNILEWLVEQRGRGIIVSLIRESDLANEPDLLFDFAIYGDRARGVQELNENSRTVRFVLSFDQPSIREALDRWERLKLYSISFEDLVDHLEN